jgi:CRISPR-associated protein Csm3
MEIGGLDHPVIRDPGTGYPYIPGSSLKGKLRHLIEYLTANVNPSGDVSFERDIVRIFGLGADDKENANKKWSEEEERKLKEEDKIKYSKIKNVGLTRLIVRDAHPDEATIQLWEGITDDGLYTSVKPENSIDRITSAANPRFIEQVVKDSAFDFEMVYGYYETVADDLEAVNKDIRHLVAGMRYLEHHTLGGSGSRGYGKIAFEIETPVWLEAKDYINGGEDFKNVTAPCSNLKPLQERKIEEFLFSKKKAE